MTVDPTGKFAYVVNVFINGVSGAVSAFSISSNGALTPVPGSPFPAGLVPESLAVDPTGKFAYVANLKSLSFSFFGAVSAFGIGSNGALTPVPGSPFPAGFNPHSVAVDHTGKFAYVANEFSNNVSAFSIGSNGALTPVPGSPFAAIGEDPVSVAVDPTGQFAYVADFGISGTASRRVAWQRHDGPYSSSAVAGLDLQLSADLAQAFAHTGDADADGYAHLLVA